MRELEPSLSQELEYVHMPGKNNGKHNPEIVLVGFEHFFRFGERRLEASENIPEPLCWRTLKQIRESNYQYRRTPMNLQFYQMRNIYGFIQQQTLRCWEKHNPALYVVVGTVEEQTGSPGVRLESVANTDYILRDTLNLLPGKDCYTQRFSTPHLKDHRLKPFLDLNKIAGYANAAGDTSIPVTVSCVRSGYYLSDYAFYQALYHGRNRAMCIRLNCGAGHATEIEYAEVVKNCITAALEQLHWKGILKAQDLVTIDSVLDSGQR